MSSHHEGKYEGKIDDALYYTPLSHTYGQYQLTKVVQQTGAQTVTITAAGGQESLFEIPAKVVNFSKSIIQFTLAPMNNVTFNWLYADGFAQIRQLQLYTRSGLYLCDINDFDRYSNMTMRRENLSEDVITWDTPLSTADGNALNPMGFFEGLAPPTAAQAGASPRPAVNGSSVALNESVYCIIGATTSYQPVINVRFELNKAVNTILAENKDLYFAGEILYLRIVWAPTSKIFFINTGGFNGILAPSAPAAGINVSITNLLLLLAVETDPMIENMIKAKTMTAEGLQLLVPMVYYNKLSLGPSLNQNMTTRYNRAHGIKLKKIYWAIYNSIESANTAFDHNCLPTQAALVWTPLKLSSFYTMINNMRTAQYDYRICDTGAGNFYGDDWMVKRNSLRDCSIYTSNEYYYNWVWVEDFTDNNRLLKNFNEITDNFIEGLDLTNEIKYDIYANTVIPVAVGTAGNPYNHYIYAVTEKLLTVATGNITLI